MVTKMKMFGVLNSKFNNQSQSQNQGQNQNKNQFRSTSVSQQFNLASIMKMQSSGCKSCRG